MAEFQRCIEKINAMELRDLHPTVTPSRQVRVRDFPTALAVVVGEDVLNDAPTVGVVERGTGYLDGCFYPSMMPLGGIVKGIDNNGRVSFTFTVCNPRWESINSLARNAGIPRHPVQERILFTIFQRYTNDHRLTPNQVTWCHRWVETIPSNDGRFLYDCVMRDEKYIAVGEIFAGTHSDLRLCA